MCMPEELRTRAQRIALSLGGAVAGTLVWLATAIMMGH